MLNLMNHQMTNLLAFARSVMQSLGLLPASDQRPAMALVPVSRTGRFHRESFVSCDHGYRVQAGVPAGFTGAAVRVAAAPITEGWRSPDFGKIKTGNTGHSQPSRFAT